MKIYAGQTLEGVMTLTNDDGSLMDDLSSVDIKLLLRNRYDDYYVLLEKAGMSVSGSKVTFTIPPEKTKELRVSAILELKVTQGGKVRIARQDNIEVEDNRIKDL